MDTILTITLLAIPAATFALLVFLIVWQRKKDKKLEQIVYPSYTKTIKEAQKEAQEIVWKAMEEARRLRVEAELQGIRALAEEKLETRELEKQYKEALEEVVTETSDQLYTYRKDIQEKIKEVTDTVEAGILKELPSLKEEMEGARSRIIHTLATLENSIKETDKSYAYFIDSLKKIIGDQLEQNKAVVQKEAEKISAQFAQAQKTALADQKDLIRERLDEEFEKVREKIEHYRQNHIDFIDTYIIALVEETVSITLQRKLSAEEHAAFVYDALEEAKKRGVFH